MTTRIGLFLALAILLVIAILSGCSTGGGGHSRGSVSNAADRAAEEEERASRGTGRRTRTKDDHQSSSSDLFIDDEDDEGSFLGNLVLSIFFSGGDDEDENQADHPVSADSETPADQPRYNEFAFSDHSDEDPYPTLTSARDTSTTYRHNLIVWYSQAALGGDTIENVSTVSLLYSGYSGKRFRGHAGLYYGKGDKGSQARVQAGIRDISEFGVDIGGRDYLTPHHTLMGFYLLFGARAGFLSWSYTNGIQAPTSNGTETIDNDAVFLFTPYIGVGSSIVQVKQFHLGASVSWGPRITLFKTLESFDNDLFRDVGELRLNFEMSSFF